MATADAWSLPREDPTWDGPYYGQLGVLAEDPDARGWIVLTDGTVWPSWPDGEYCSVTDSKPEPLKTDTSRGVSLVASPFASGWSWYMAAPRQDRCNAFGS